MDSGSDVNVLPFSYVIKLNTDDKKIINHGMKARVYGGFWLNIKGKINIKYGIGQMRKKLSL